MTAATANPSYDVTSVPEAPGDGSRYALEVGPGGFAATGGVCGNIVAVYSQLLGARIAEAKAALPPLQEVALKAVVIREGQYMLASRGVVSGPLAFENRRPVRRWRKKLGGAFLDSLFLGQEDGAFGQGPDLEVFEAMLALAEQQKFSGRQLRSLNDQVALLVLARAGVSCSVEQLPHPPV